MQRWLKSNDDAALFGCVHQGHVQLGARNGVDDFGVVLAVTLEGEFAGDGMHHAALHGDDDLLHRIPYSGLLQRVNAAGGEREIDGASGADSDATHIWPAFINSTAKPRFFNSMAAGPARPEPMSVTSMLFIREAQHGARFPELREEFLVERESQI